MKKLFILALALLSITACKNSPKKASDPAPVSPQTGTTEPEAPKGPASVEYVGIPMTGEDGSYDRIIVQKLVDGEKTWEHTSEFVVNVSPDAMALLSADLISYKDINFDGTEDLLVYLGLNAVGRVEQFEEAFLLGIEDNPVLVKEYRDIPNPELDPENKTVTGSTKSGPYEMVSLTYKWKGKSLELSDEKTEIFLAPEEIVSVALEIYHEKETSDDYHADIDRWAFIDIDGDEFPELLIQDSIGCGAVFTLKGGINMIGETDYKVSASLFKGGVIFAGSCGGPCYYTKVVSLKDSREEHNAEYVAVYGEVEEYHLDGNVVDEPTALALHDKVAAVPLGTKPEWIKF